MLSILERHREQSAASEELQRDVVRQVTVSQGIEVRYASGGSVKQRHAAKGKCIKTREPQRGEMATQLAREVARTRIVKLC